MNAVRRLRCSAGPKIARYRAVFIDQDQCVTGRSGTRCRNCRKEQHAMKVADVMTRRVTTVGSDATVAEAARLMLSQSISGLPVVTPSGVVIGIVTEGDLLHRAETGTERRRSRWLEFLVGPGRIAGEYARAHARKVGEVMSLVDVAATTETPLEQVVEL